MLTRNGIKNARFLVNRGIYSNLGTSLQLKPFSSKADIDQSQLQNYEHVLSRTANIVMNIAEKMTSKILHFNCDDQWMKYFDDGITYLHVEGATNQKDKLELSRATKRYRGVHLLNYEEEMFEHLAPSSYHFVVNIPTIAATEFGPNLTEIVRLLTQRGFGVVGAYKDLWEKEDIHGKLMVFDKKGSISYLTQQNIPVKIDGKDSQYIIAVFRKVVV